MVKEGVATKLLSQLKQTTSETSKECPPENPSPELQHAIFSCLRNLAIPGV